MQKLPEDQMLFLALNICFKSRVVINHKPSNCLASNDNPYKPLVRNLLNPFRREELIYLKVLALFFCVLSISVLYSTHFFLPSTRNKRHNFLFIGKPKNPINDKISICPLNNIIYIILG
jgi:hypothetical protein